MEKIFDDQSTSNNWNMNKLKFYRNMYYSSGSGHSYSSPSPFRSSDEYFFKLKYRLNKKLLNDFLTNDLNLPLKFIENKNKNLILDTKVYMNMTDQEFQNALIDEVHKVKTKSNDPIIEKVIGWVKFSNINENYNINEEIITQSIDDNIYNVKGGYKFVEITIESNSKSNQNLNPKRLYNIEIGLLLIGRNITNNKEYLEKFIQKLAGEIPANKPYRGKNDLTEDEIFNLNLINFERDLPEGWYRDGPVFLDENDNRYAQHPRKIF
jgi:hypothetical protein